jgi:acyl homoserine lactone synthase
MIKLICEHERQEFPELMDAMHRLRKQLFHDRLKWDVSVKGEWEIDNFDQEDPLYILSIDKDGQLQGSLRLLPTTGPNMLRDVFGKTTEKIGAVVNPMVWESRRFCIRLPNGKDHRDSQLISKATVELIAGVGEVGLLAGLDHIVTVYDAILRRIIRQTGCREDLIGEPARFGRVMSYAGLFDINPVEIDAFKRVWNLPDNLVEHGGRNRLSAA